MEINDCLYWCGVSAFNLINKMQDIHKLKMLLRCSQEQTELHAAYNFSISTLNNN